MPNFQKRSQQPEWMDIQATTFAEFHHCLQTLEKINICTLAYPPTLKWLRERLTEATGRSTSIWDVGSGGGDMLRRGWKLARRLGAKVELTGIDLHPFSQRSARVSTPARMSIQFEHSNIFEVAPGRQADLIISSLFTHHLSDEELVRFIKWMESHAQRGWFINDLHRHPIAFYFIKTVVRGLGLNRLVRHDASVSVARSFTRDEWIALLGKAGVPLKEVTIKWHFPFRYCVSRVKS